MSTKRKSIYYNIFDTVKTEGKDILLSNKFRITDYHIQHGEMSVRKHCINVARYSLFFAKKLKINCNEEELIRGALLHDYFLYDWHDKQHINITNLHGFHHPGIALKNAKKDYRLTLREQDIIKKHMWPLTVVPPMCKEAWIVTAADKYCSLLETLKFHKARVKDANEKYNYHKQKNYTKGLLK